MRRKKHLGDLKKVAKRAKRVSKKMVKENGYLFSDENPAYLADKEKLFSLLKGNKTQVHKIFYKVESLLKFKKKRDAVFKYCTDFVNGKIKERDVIFFLNYEEPKIKKKARWWPYKK